MGWTSSNYRNWNTQQTGTYTAPTPKRISLCKPSDTLYIVSDVSETQLSAYGYNEKRSSCKMNNYTT